MDKPSSCLKRSMTDVKITLEFNATKRNEFFRYVRHDEKDYEEITNVFSENLSTS